MFGAAVARYAGLSVDLPFARWEDALAYLLGLTKDRPTPVVIDEFPFLIKASPQLPSLLKRELDERGPSQQTASRAGSGLRLGHVGHGPTAGGQRATARPGQPGDDRAAVRVPRGRLVLGRDRSAAGRPGALDHRRHARLPAPVCPRRRAGRSRRPRRLGHPGRAQSHRPAARGPLPAHRGDRHPRSGHPPLGARRRRGRSPEMGGDRSPTSAARPSTSLIRSTSWRTRAW